ncbi:hypothetical protein GIB67_016329 [Kingdonia uniflora]|uniref:Aminotransferase-like plant mobile domain-containing protein n=1 Tax=Kingdonia uniflora TaxID=39325 RepID=A0A7J7M9F3_9MAGN|nr:hypothetical protein GIB67_016329 [Kingdonia uniflora]
MANGHMIPIIETARMFAIRGVKATIITTPLNVSLLSQTVERDRRSGIDIGIQLIQFPTLEVGLPEGCENLEMVTSSELVMNFFTAVFMLKEPLKQLLEEHRPDCLVSDMFLPWTSDVSAELGITNIVFQSISFFSLAIFDCARSSPSHEDDKDTFVAHGLPDKVEIPKSHLADEGTNRLMGMIRKSELSSFAVMVNSFYEMEPAYAEHYKKAIGKKPWHIGPVSLSNKNIIDKAQRGKKSTIDEHCCLNWLDSKKPSSVIYVSFGSMSRFCTAQLFEIAIGLEASKVPFIWVARKSKKETNEHFLPEGFEERLEGKGLIIRDWAPQVLILEHPAIGGFVTHCGWNSILEGVSAGVPMITWPLFGEQFYNEKFVTEVLKIGIKAGVEVWTSWMEQDNVSLKREDIEKVVAKLMGSGEDVEEMRERVGRLSEIAKKSVEKGGSSYEELSCLIEEITLDVSEHNGAHIEDGDEVRVTEGSQIQSESAQAALGAQPMLPTDCDVNIDSVGKNCEYSARHNCEGEGAVSNEEVGPIDTSLLRSFKFHKTRIDVIVQEKACLRVHHHPSTWDLTKEPQMVFEKNLLLDFRGFKALKAGDAGNYLSLKKLREHYAHKLEKVLSDGTTKRAKKKGLTTRSVAHAYMLYVLGFFLFPTKKGTDVSVRYLDFFAKDKVAKKWSWESAVLAHMYHNLGAASRDDGRQFACCTTLLEVVWDPYRDKKAFAHGFKEINYFYGALASPDHVHPYYPNRIVQQFSRE